MKTILIIKLRYIGDVILSLPVLKMLREHYPAARLICLVNPGTQDVLTFNPHVDEVLVMARGSFREQFQFLLELRSHHFDCVIDLTDGDRSAFLSWFSGAPRRIGFNREHRWRGMLYSDCIDGELEDDRHMIFQHAQALRPLGVTSLSFDPIIDVSEEYSITVQTKLETLRLFHQPWVMIHTTARYWFKAWPIERFAILINKLQNKGIPIVLVGHAADQKEASFLQEQAKGPLISLVGETSLLELPGFMKNASLFVGNDTGLMHMAAAVGCPVVALFGPTDPEVWGPRGPKVRTIYKGLDCRACFHPGCSRGEESCMKQISVDEVSSAVLELLHPVMSKYSESK